MDTPLHYQEQTKYLRSSLKTYVCWRMEAPTKSILQFYSSLLHYLQTILFQEKRI